MFTICSSCPAYKPDSSNVSRPSSADRFFWLSRDYIVVDTVGSWKLTPLLVRMMPQKAKRISDKDWQVHKHTLERLWIQENKKLDGKLDSRDSVKQIMQTEYSFSAT